MTYSRASLLLRDDRGAVTVDWVAIVSAVLLLGIAVVYAVYNTGVASTVESINEALGGAIAAISGSGATSDPNGVSGPSGIMTSDGGFLPAGTTLTDKGGVFGTGSLPSQWTALAATPDGTNVYIGVTTDVGTPLDTAFKEMDVMTVQSDGSIQYTDKGGQLVTVSASDVQQHSNFDCGSAC